MVLLRCGVENIQRAGSFSEAGELVTLGLTIRHNIVEHTIPQHKRETALIGSFTSSFAYIPGQTPFLQHATIDTSLHKAKNVPSTNTKEK